MKRDGSANTTFAYDSANQLQTQQDGTGRTTFVFDANGNQALQVAPAGGRTTNSWDYEDRLTRVALPTGQRDTFQYDPDGKRIRRDDSNGTTKPVWDEQSVLLETNQGDTTQVVYSVEPTFFGNVIAQERISTSRYYHFDGAGSTDRLTDSSGTVTDSFIYRAFGESVTSVVTTSNPFRYVGCLGYYFDADLTQYYLRKRHYNQNMARFLSRDAVDKFRAPQDAYNYCLNNPINMLDPHGLFPFGGINPIGYWPKHEKPDLANPTVTRPEITGRQNCGGLETQVTFKVRSQVDGWIIQKVDVDPSVFLCPTVPKTKPTKALTSKNTRLSFYEAWQVIDNKIFQGKANLGRNNFGGNDTFGTYDEGMGTLGFVTIRTQIVFIPRFRPRFVPSGRWSEPGMPGWIKESISLATHPISPLPFILFPNQFSLERMYMVRWCCCEGKLDRTNLIEARG